MNNNKTTSCILAATLLISMAALFGLSTVQAQPTTLAITAAPSASMCANNLVSLTATLSSGSNTDMSSVTWHTSSATGTFGVPSSTATTSTITYDDSGAINPITVTITANYPGDSNNGASSNTITLTIYNTLDFNQDSKVNFNDVLFFAQAYIANAGGTYNSLIDLDHGGVINFNDILTFVGLYDAYTGPV